MARLEAAYRATGALPSAGPVRGGLRRITALYHRFVPPLCTTALYHRFVPPLIWTPYQIHFSQDNRCHYF
jgi:hypothetical protein